MRWTSYHVLDASAPVFRPPLPLPTAHVEARDFVMLAERIMKMSPSSSVASPAPTAIVLVEGRDIVKPKICPRGVKAVEEIPTQAHSLGGPTSTKSPVCPG